MTEVLAVDAVDVTKRYGDLTAVDAITLQVAQGEVYGVLGPNGAGKTTFLRMLFGLIRPDAGTIKLFGQTREDAGTRTLDGVSGFIESPKFYPYLSGRKNLAGLARLEIKVFFESSFSTAARFMARIEAVCFLFFVISSGSRYRFRQI